MQTSLDSMASDGAVTISNVENEERRVGAGDVRVMKKGKTRNGKFSRGLRQAPSPPFARRSRTGKKRGNETGHQDSGKGNQKQHVSKAGAYESPKEVPDRT